MPLVVILCLVPKKAFDESKPLEVIVGNDSPSCLSHANLISMPDCVLVFKELAFWISFVVCLF